jgi:hypothetical protein
MKCYTNGLNGQPRASHIISESFGAFLATVSRARAAARRRTSGLARINRSSQESFANLADTSFLANCDLLQAFLQFEIDPNTDEYRSWHQGDHSGRNGSCKENRS